MSTQPAAAARREWAVIYRDARVTPCATRELAEQDAALGDDETKVVTRLTGPWQETAGLNLEGDATPLDALSTEVARMSRRCAACSTGLHMDCTCPDGDWRKLLQTLDAARLSPASELRPVMLGGREEDTATSGQQGRWADVTEANDADLRQVIAVAGAGGVAAYGNFLNAVYAGLLAERVTAVAGPGILQQNAALRATLAAAGEEFEGLELACVAALPCLDETQAGILRRRICDVAEALKAADVPSAASGRVSDAHPPATFDAVAVLAQEVATAQGGSDLGEFPGDYEQITAALVAAIQASTEQGAALRAALLGVEREAQWHGLRTAPADARSDPDVVRDRLGTSQ